MYPDISRAHLSCQCRPHPEEVGRTGCVRVRKAIRGHAQNICCQGKRRHPLKGRWKRAPGQNTNGAVGHQMQRSATKTENGAQNGVEHRFRLRNVSIGTRLAVCFSVIIGLMIAADAVAFWQFERMEAVGQRLRKADQTSRAVIRVRLDIGIFRERVALMAEARKLANLPAIAQLYEKGSRTMWKPRGNCLARHLN